MAQTPIELNDAVPGRPARTADNGGLQSVPRRMSDVERPLAEAFGVERRFAAESTAPPVDWEMIVRYVRHELSSAEHEAIGQLIARYQSWFDACTLTMRSRLTE